MLDRVTITGADDNASIQEMVDLSSEFPFVEWAILVSKNREGSDRYPARAWCGELESSARELVYSDRQGLMRIAMHVCGAWARQAFTGSLNWGELPAVRSIAQRVQVNGTPSSRLCSIFPAVEPWQQFIFQFPRGAEYVLAARAAGFNAVPLLDESGGRGVSRSDWPAMLPGVYCGRAGGIGPYNVASVIEAIQNTCSDPFWIDMEGGVRDSWDRLDMAKVRRVLELCVPFVDGGVDAER